jgi:hypothetical protein
MGCGLPARQIEVANQKTAFSVSLKVYAKAFRKGLSAMKMREPG